ncbi:MAG: hypothetical protein ABI946_09440 [Chthoniobacterales bacterium]
MTDFARLGADELGEGVGLEDTGVFREETKENTHEQSLEFVPAKAALLQGIVQLAHAPVGFLVRGIFGIETNARLPEHEGEGAHMAREFSEREVMRLDLAAGKKRKLFLVFRLQVVEDKAREIGDKDEARNFLPAILPREVFDIGESLCLGEGEVFAEALARRATGLSKGDRSLPCCFSDSERSPRRMRARRAAGRRR